MNAIENHPEEYDAIIIGAGQAGVPLSRALANAGWKTALIERQHVGGTCINEGCTPTKTMVASARAAYMARRSEDFGVHSGEISVDMVKVRQRKRDIVDSFRASNRKRLENTDGLELMMGLAVFSGPKTVKVQLNPDQTEANRQDTRYLTAERIFINTGARPRQIDLPGLSQIPYLNSTSIMELDQVPEHLLIIGGGYVGVEFSQMFRRFGSRVTIIQRGEQLLSREDADVAGAVTDILQEDGIQVLLNSHPTCVERTTQGKIRLTVKREEKQQILEGSHLLVAAGRVPNTDELNLQVTGVETDQRGYIQANERLETNIPDIYALGDVKGGPAFTHISYDDYRIIRDNLLEGKERAVNERLIPYTVFIDPQLGRVGLTEKQARQSGLDFKVASMPMNWVARALEVDEPRGMMKAIVDAQSKQILGCAILGIEGGEVMALIQTAMMGNLPYTALKEAVYAHPTLAESMNTLFSQIE
jgi:pyruvate/2-oxoglutarate dehydrogenase complex dihydrolipoamide dehydrogenase (E3) component